MNKLNPIYILALIVTLFVISFFLLNNKKNEFKNISSNYNSTILTADNFSKYKKTWFNKKKILKKIDSIIKHSSFKKEKIFKIENKNIIRIKITSSNPKVLNKFLNRVLNEKFIVKKLDLKKDSILFEIGFK